MRPSARAIAVLALASAAGSVPSPVNAGAPAPSMIAYELLSSDLLQFGLCGGPTDAAPYRLAVLRPTVAGDYVFTDTHVGTTDGALAIYRGAFDPAATSDRCLARVDESAVVALDLESVYVVALTANDSLLGSVLFSVTGPAALALDPYVPLPTTTTITSADPDGSAVLSATVTDPAGGSPTGMVTFYAGSVMLGTATVTDGTATLVVATTVVDGAQLTAAYSGTDLHAGSISNLIFHGSPPATTTPGQSTPEPDESPAPSTTVVPASPAPSPVTSLLTISDSPAPTPPVPAPAPAVTGSSGLPHVGGAAIFTTSLALTFLAAGSTLVAAAGRRHA